MPAVNFIYKPPWPVLSFRQALYNPPLHAPLVYIAMRDADTTYKASSKAKGKHGSQQHLMQSLCKETHASATSRYNTLRGVKVNKNASLHPVVLEVYISSESHIVEITPPCYSPLVQRTRKLWRRDDSLVVSLTWYSQTKVMVPCVGLQKGEAPVKQIGALENARGTLKLWYFNDIMRAVACISYPF